MIKAFESDFKESYGKIWVNGTNFFKLDLKSYFADPDGDKLSYGIIRTNGTAVPLWLGKDIEN